MKKDIIKKYFVQKEKLLMKSQNYFRQVKFLLSFFLRGDMVGKGDITSNLLRTIFEEWPVPKLIVLTVQKEVAKRIVAKPPDMNLLALSVQFYSEPKIIGYISKGSFRPMPKVDSAIIKLTPHNQPTSANPEMFFKLVKAGFSGKRKQLINNLVKNFGMIREDLLRIFEKMTMKQDVRAENLSLNQWIELSKLMEK